MDEFLFRMDDGLGVGAGHLMRCLALAEEICQSGRKVHLLATRPSVLHHRWRVIGADVMILDCRIGSEEDLAVTLQAASLLEANWVVVDGYGFTVDWLDALGGERNTLCLDDIALRDPSVAMVLNHNPGAEQRYAGSYRRCKQALLGSDWFLLRSEFKNQVRCPENGQILVCLGGEDPDKRTLLVIRALVARTGMGFGIDVVCNSAQFAGIAEMAELAMSAGWRFQVHPGPLALTPLMGRAHVMICGGGVTAVEALSMGLNVVAIVLADNQAEGIAYLASTGALQVVQVTGDWAEDAASAALEYVARSGSTNDQKMSFKFDGGGAGRVFARMIAQ